METVAGYVDGGPLVAESLPRPAALRPTGPVLSLYLDLDPPAGRSGSCHVATSSSASASRRIAAPSMISPDSSDRPMRVSTSRWM
jgi:hypothetical protein